MFTSGCGDERGKNSQSTAKPPGMFRSGCGDERGMILNQGKRNRQACLDRDVGMRGARFIKILPLKMEKHRSCRNIGPLETEKYWSPSNILRLKTEKISVSFTDLTVEDIEKNIVLIKRCHL